jgi:hypothetical protein
MHWFTFHLPVKTYIKKYLSAHYGHPILLDLKDDIGFVLLNTLASRLESKASRGYLDLWKKRYDDKIVFRIPFHYFSITKKEISPFTIVLLNRYIENKFEEELHRFVTNKTELGITFKRSIEMFLEKSGIDLEVDISSDAIIKSEWRYRKKKEKLFSRILSSPQPQLFRA